LKSTLLITCALVVPISALAGELRMPAGARLQTERFSPLADYALPVGSYTDGAVSVRDIQGAVLRRSWRIDGGSSTILQLAEPLRAQLLADGYRIDFECGTRACGGFDFRFGIEVIPAPDMAVDIGNFHFLSATKGTGEAKSVLVSRIGSSGFIQVIEVAEQGATTAPEPARPAEAPVLQSNATLMSELLAEGHVVLGDLKFRTGSSELDETPAESLSLLAVLLNGNETYRVVLVGHTDSVGALEDNLSLSRQRAAAVRRVLIDRYGVDPEQVDADGVGYLAPLGSNLTEEGRRANRRVEAVLLYR